MTPTASLRRLLARPGLLLAPFVYDGFTARIAEAAGFEAVYMSGFGTAMSYGFPDVGLLTGTEMAGNAAMIARAVSVPVIADADTGYGNAINVWRTVQEYQAAGVAALHIEDQVFPKKCGFFAGKDVVPLEEHVQKVRAAVDARSDPDFVIIARCDALVIEGWRGVVRRCRAYWDAGADMIFVDGIATPDDVRTYAGELGEMALLLNSDVVPASFAEDLGFKLQIHRGPMFLLHRFIRQHMEELRRTGFVPASADQTPELRREIAALLGLDQINQMEDRYRS